MRKATTLLALLLLLGVGSAMAQDREFALDIPLSEEFTAAYTLAIHSGARGVTGPYDLDGDGNVEILLTDYTGGGRVHVIENAGVDTWELVYSTPWNDSTATTQNARYAVGGDLDDDGNGEIIFLSGRSYSDTNPNAGQFAVGLFVYEYTGTDNDYGAFPASIYDFPGDVPDRWSSEMLAIADVDNDGVQELMMPNNGGTGFNQYDSWWIFSVTGDIGGGFEVWFEEERISSRASEDFDPVNRGGGSAYAIHPADLDGDGQLDLSLHSWNNFNFFNGRATAPDTYEFPADGAVNGNLQAAPNDHVSLFGGVVVDIDGNGDDEVFYPRFQTGDVSLLNYEDGEDILQITEDNLILDLLDGVSSLGITAGDFDGDGNMEVIGAGTAYSASRRTNNLPPIWVRVAEFLGGDPEDPANYEISALDYFEPFDTLETQFDYVIRDSAGVITEFLEDTNTPRGKDRGGISGQDPIFVSKLTFLGDADGDGFGELALAYQGIDDSTYVIQETFNPADSSRTRVALEARAAPQRWFLRILSGGPDFTVDTEERIVVPSDYVLSPNYPNPFNPSTSFTFTLPIDKRVSIRIYDVTGRLVRTLVNDELYTAGTHQATWDGTNDARMQVASGTYLYTLEYGNFRQARTMLLIK